jgi:hypothetical protein
VVSGQASHGREPTSAAISVARAFQPEICPLRLVRLEIAVMGGGSAGGWTHAKTRRREEKRSRAVGSRRASQGREPTSAAISVARAFQPEICPLRLVRLEIAVMGRGLCRRLDSREDAKPRRKTPKGRWAVVGRATDGSRRVLRLP